MLAEIDVGGGPGGAVLPSYVACVVAISFNGGGPEFESSEKTDVSESLPVPPPSPPTISFKGGGPDSSERMDAMLSLPVWLPSKNGSSSLLPRSWSTNDMLMKESVGRPGKTSVYYYWKSWQGKKILVGGYLNGHT